VEARVLARALEVAPHLPGAEGEDRAHVHGFHSYPARSHPVTVARLVEDFSLAGSTVLDPFCGSGTVLVEAMRLGRATVGTDLNPVAVKLATLKTRAHSEDELRGLVAAAEGAAAFAEDRRRARAGATRRYGLDDVALFDPHVLLELDSLRAATQKLVEPQKMELLLVLSSILVKLSRKRGDTSEETVPRRLAAGYPSSLFVRKTLELVARLRELETGLPSPRPRARVALEDAGLLPSVGEASVDLIVTSPPYAGTYDYLAHHALRIRWLGLDAAGLSQGEMGARRLYAAMRDGDVRGAWARELERMLRSAERVLRPGGALVLLIGDSVVGKQPLRADDMVAAAADGTRMRCIARASQARPHFHGPTARVFQGQPRAEHALLLRRG
jgi:SAM-dependent methyltransferase